MFEKIAQERDEAIIDAVMNDKFKKYRKYCQKYGIPIPTSQKIMKASVYKAAQYCTNISNEVKQVALEKCVRLGFNPFIDPRTTFPEK